MTEDGARADVFAADATGRIFLTGEGVAVAHAAPWPADAPSVFEAALG